MRFPRDYKLHLIATKGPLRDTPPTDRILYHREKGTGLGRLVACSNIAMATVPVYDDENDDPGFIPRAAVEEATKRPPNGKDAVLHHNGSTEVETRSGAAIFHALPEPDRGFPNCSTLPDPGQGKLLLALDPSLLLDLARAIGAKDGIVIERDGDDPAHPIVVRPYSEADAHGVMMPLSPPR